MGRLVKGGSWPNLFSARVPVKLSRRWAREHSQREKWGRERGERLKGLREAVSKGGLLADHLCFRQTFSEVPRCHGWISVSGFFILSGDGGGFREMLSYSSGAKSEKSRSVQEGAAHIKSIHNRTVK